MMRGPAAALIVVARGTGWVVVAKPPGLLTHRNRYAPRAPAALQQVRDQEGREVYPIHRLDAAASGCLLFATDRAMAGPLSAALTAGEKIYLALVRGVCPADATFVAAGALKDDTGRMKAAKTALRCLGSDPDRRCALVEARPETGRYHQIRRHLRRLSHPIIGDRHHGDSHVNRSWRARGVRRLALHCLSIRLTLPDGQTLAADCPLFDDLAGPLSGLAMWPAAQAALPVLNEEALPTP
ncbi:MAG: pseudouridine synthase [Myxococcota bacterium]